MNKLEFIGQKFKNFKNFIFEEFGDYDKNNKLEGLKHIEINEWIILVRANLRNKDIETEIKQFLEQNGLSYGILVVEKPDAIDKLERYLTMFSEVIDF